jgi:cytochrome P450
MCKGPTVRVGPNRYSVSHPADVKQIYALGGKFSKTAYYDPASSLERDNIFSVRDMADHAERRRKISSLYSMSTMVAYEPAVDETTTVFTRKLNQLCSEKREFSLPGFLQNYAFDVIGSITVMLSDSR